MVESNRKYDLAIFGASGVTGEYVIAELAVHHPKVSWCVAGRSVEKLRSVLQNVGQQIGKDLKDIHIVQADARDESSLAAMCQAARVLINCVGPYRFSGEKVVEQCVKYKTHCVDVSGEPQFLETVQLKYFEEAKSKGVYIVGSCGFDSIPCDIGVDFLKKEFDGELDSVETILIQNQPDGSTVNYATWESAIHGLAHGHELKPLRKALMQTLFTKKLPRPDYPLKARPYIFKSDLADGWCLPFIGSDRSVILRSQMFNYQFKDERPVQVQTYMKGRSFFTTLVTILMGGIFTVMTKFAMGRMLLERFPEIFSCGVFSRSPPEKEKARSGSFKVIVIGRGWSETLSNTSDKHTAPPNKSQVAVVHGPDPGYISTAVCVTSSALVLLSEQEKLPFTGGVFTPATAFRDTSLIQKLRDRGMTISCV